MKNILQGERNLLFDLEDRYAPSPPNLEVPASGIGPVCFSLFWILKARF
jgi:hypothetical protein